MQTTPKGLTPWTDGTLLPPTSQKCVAVGSEAVGCPEITHRRGQKSTFIYGNDTKAKTVPNVPLGFPEYGMTNASNFRWGFSLPATPKGCEKGGIYLRD